MLPWVLGITLGIVFEDQQGAGIEFDSRRYPGFSPIKALTLECYMGIERALGIDRLRVTQGAGNIRYPGHCGPSRYGSLLRFMLVRGPGGPVGWFTCASIGCA